MPRPKHIIHLPGGQSFLTFELGDALVIGCDDTGVCRVDNTVDQLLDLAIMSLDSVLERLRRLRRPRCLDVPGALDHGLDDREETVGRGKRLQKLLNLAFEIVARLRQVDVTVVQGTPLAVTMKGT